MNDHMRSLDKELEDLLSDAATAFAPPEGLKQTIRAKMEAVGRQSATTDGDSENQRRPRGRTGGTLRLARWLAPAAAACLVVAAIVGLWPSEPVVQSAYAQLAAAVENSKKAEWVHVVMVDFPGDGGQVNRMEWWRSFKPGRIGSREATGECEFVDKESGDWSKYEPSTGTVTIRDAYPSSANECESAVDAIAKSIQEFRDEGGKVVSSNEVVSGKPCVVHSLRSAEGKERHRVAIDTAENRIVRVWQFHEGQEYPADVDYPPTGPNDIYDLGAPRIAGVVDKRTLDKQGWSMFSGAVLAAERFERDFYAVVYRGSLNEAGKAAGRNLTVFYSKNGRHRVDDYDVGPQALSGENLGELEAWISTHTPSKVAMSSPDGGAYYHVTSDEVTRRDESGDVHGACIDATWLVNTQWITLRRYGKKIPDIMGPNGRLLGTERLADADVQNEEGKQTWWPCRWRVYVNPARDYVAERWELVDGRGDEPWGPKDPEAVRAQRRNRWYMDENLRRQSVTVLEYAQTPAGHWYARKKLFENEDWDGNVTKSVMIIHLDTERKIPDSVFDQRKFEAELQLPVKRQ